MKKSRITDKDIETSEEMIKRLEEKVSKTEIKILKPRLRDVSEVEILEKEDSTSKDSKKELDEEKNVDKKDKKSDFKEEVDKEEPDDDIIMKDFIPKKTWIDVSNELNKDKNKLFKVMTIIGILFVCYFITNVTYKYITTTSITVQGESMLPTFKNGQNVRVKVVTEPEKLVLKRGDVVLCGKDLNVNLIKRVTGIPGDRIDYVEGNLFVNGEYVEGPNKDMTKTQAKDIYDEYLKHSTQAGEMKNLTEKEMAKVAKKITTVEPIILESNQYWITSDNLATDTIDSRTTGPVEIYDILGKYMKFSLWNIFEW